jgi:hypothetical protein
MTLPRSVADVLDRHVTFEIESIDRMYLNVYQPRLQYPKGAAAFFHFHRGHTFASSALMAPMTKAFVTAVHEFVIAHDLDLVLFAKGQRKDDLTQQVLAGHDSSECVLYVGQAQEKATVMRTERRYGPTGTPYAWLVKASALVNHFYFYCFDDDFGPFFLKFCSYFPYNAKLCINGHEWAKRQAAKKGIGFTALDNGFAAVDDPAKVQAICDRLGPRHIDALLRKWLRRLPHPSGSWAGSGTPVAAADAGRGVGGCGGRAVHADPGHFGAVHGLVCGAQQPSRGGAEATAGVADAGSHHHRLPANADRGGGDDPPRRPGGAGDLLLVAGDEQRVLVAG